MATASKKLVLVFIRQEGRILLGYKKRGFGQGNWNGFGGKLEAGESFLDAAIREVREEAGITPSELFKRAVLHFYFGDDPAIHEVHVFLGKKFAGEIVESDEMRPQWFEVADIPYDKMWVDDQHWLPQVLAGKHMAGNFWFDAKQNLLRYDVKEVTSYA